MSTLMERLHRLREDLDDRYARLGSGHKIMLWIWTCVNLAILGMFIIVGPDRIFRILCNWADDLREAPLGWLFLLIALCVTSVPPLFGYSTCVTLCGFAFGWLKGWLIASAGCLLGSALAFSIARRAIQRFAPYLDQQPTFRGLAAAVRMKGTSLVVLIRLCPFPFGYSNAFFASIESVSLPQFLFATLAITPKLLLHVWVGERMYLLADPESRRKMDSTTWTVNILGIVLGSALGIFTSWYVYRLVQQHVRSATALEIDNEAQLLPNGQLDDDEEEEDDEDDVDAIERRLVAEGHLAKDPAARPSMDQWNADAFSDFGDEEERSGVPRVIITPSPVVEEDDPWDARGRPTS